MPGTRNAPAVNGTPTYKRVSYRLIDANGDKKAYSLDVPAAALDADIEDLAAKLQLATNASLYEIVQENVYSAFPISANALDVSRESISDHFVIGLKDSVTRRLQNGYIPAPLDTLFVPGTDTPDISQATLSNVYAAMAVLCGGNYAALSITFNEVTERNEKVVL